MRRDADGLVVVLDRLIHIAVGVVDRAAAFEGGGGLRIEPDGLVVVLDRLIVIVPRGVETFIAFVTSSGALCLLCDHSAAPGL